MSAPSCGSILSLSNKPSGSFDVHQALDALGDLVEFFDAERHGHAALAAELVDEYFLAGVAFYVFKEQRRAAARVSLRCFFAPVPSRHFDDAVSDLGDLELRRDFFADAAELAGFLECFDPVAQIVKGQRFAPVR